jgi:NAD(P)-dependent dehydrogenase (short-subunit alcohol dehydrogenase family)
MTREALSNQIFRQSVEANIPLGRLGQPEDCVGICRLLISDQAEMITGASIKVDGGWTAL